MLATEYQLTRATVRERSPEDGEAATLSVEHVKLQALKAQVPLVCQRVGRAKWSAAVHSASATQSRAARLTLASRSFHKMYEIALSCALPMPTRSVHLCEAPGGFVQALAHLRRPEDGLWESWIAISLEAGDGIPTPAVHLLPSDCGSFLTCDVMDVARTNTLVPEGLAQLVTADGATAMDHAHVEGEHFSLLQAQTTVALRALAPNGTFIIKFFEGALGCTKAWIASLTLAFDRVSVVKPTASRPTNSERYLLARGYSGNVPTFDLHRTHVVAETWLESLNATLQHMDDAQAQALERVLKQLR